MPYTNSPETSTYKSVDIKFDGTDLFRYGDTSVNRDLQIVNMYYDRASQENKTKDVKLKKRDGLANTSYNLSKASASATIRGSFNDTDQNGFYWAVGNKVYSVNPDSGTSVRTVTTLNTSSGYVGFCTFLKSTGVRYVCITDGTDLWIDDYVGLSCTEVTDPDLPSPHQPYPLYIDGYLLLIKTDTSDMYNSDVDDPTAWTSDNFIQAEIVSDYSIRLFKVKNYVINMGTGSIEYFWDAGNESGSPFSRNDSPIRGVGYITGGCQIGDTVFFVGQDNNQNIAVYTVNSFKVERVSNSIVDRTLQTYSSTANSKSNVTLTTDGHIISSNGHTFYTLVTPQTTWAYDVDEKFWYEFKGSDEEGLQIEATWGMFNGACYMAISNKTYISIMSPSLYQDFGVDFTCRYTTENGNFDTHNWKVCHRATLACSQHGYTGTSNATLSWSDKDWADGGTSGRSINVFSISPYINKLGRFRNRSFRIEYADNYPFFMTGLQLDINVMGV